MTAVKAVQVCVYSKPRADMSFYAAFFAFANFDNKGLTTFFGVAEDKLL